MLPSRKPWKDIKTTLHPSIVHALNTLNFTSMMPVQQASIPLLLKNYDIAVEAQTGSGKTLAFLIPLIQKLLNIQNLKQISIIHVKFAVLSPTRQLCQQTYNILIKLLNIINPQYIPYCHCTTGGKPLIEDINKVTDNALVIISTVGRLKELSNSFSSDWLKKVDYLYIDEADRVLKQNGIEHIIRCFQKMRRTAMFSATLAGLQPSHYEFYGMRNLAKISLKPLLEDQMSHKNYVVPLNLSNNYISFPNRLQKLYFLLQYLSKFSQQSQSKLIIFFNTCASVDFYSKLISTYLQQHLKDNQLSVFGVHGKLKTKRRKRLLDNFMKHSKSCLLATDVVSRGIDFDRIDTIIQVDPPQDPDNFVHRIGRTARVDRPGTAILLLEDHQNAFITYLQNKSVEINETNAIQYLTDQSTNKQEILESVRKIMVSDRDYIQKSKKAFVSYIRSYMEHDLKYIFQFKNASLGFIAQSFFLLRIPRIKEILGKKIDDFQQSQINIDNIPWADKNQQLQYNRKKEKLQQIKAQLQKQKNNYTDIKNNKSERRKRKRKMERQNLKQMNKEHKLIQKQKRNPKHKSNIDSDESDCDTESLERRIALKYD